MERQVIDGTRKRSILDDFIAGHSGEAIAERWGVARSTVFDLAYRSGIKRRRLVPLDLTWRLYREGMAWKEIQAAVLAETGHKFAVNSLVIAIRIKMRKAGFPVGKGRYNYGVVPRKKLIEALEACPPLKFRPRFKAMSYYLEKTYGRIWSAEVLRNATKKHKLNPMDYKPLRVVKRRHIH